MKEDYIVFNAHRIGASHINKGLNCEDFSASYADDTVAIAVISDGHGDKNCFRSARGAQIACECAISIARDTCNAAGAMSAIIQSPDRVICELEKSIIYSWNQHVLKDIEENPIKDEELESLDDNVIMAIKSGNRLVKIYGCTLILTVLLDGFWFGVHVGDGKCICVYENGLYSQPIPWDKEGCVGNRSTSLCDTKAFEKFRYVYGQEVPVAVFVGSDGVDESFDDNGINKCYYSLANWLKGLPESEYRIKADELLEKISYGGSGDDVSIACIISKQKEVKKPVSTSKQIADKMEELYTTLTGAEGRCAELYSRREELSSEIEKLDAEIPELEALLAEKKKQLMEKKAENENVIKNLLSMQSQLVPIIKQFEEARGIKKQVDEYWMRLGVEIYDNESVMNYEPTDAMKVDDVEQSTETSKNSETVKISEVVENEVGHEKQVALQERNKPVEQKIVLREKQSPNEEYQKIGFLGNIFRKK